ncbi:hypothetical protein [Halomontanus rarus]|uniref:hypothetical protein n=1 Tax=Halomontanus rarus TaxID=3034020 RepID=UPI001A999281
MTNPRPEIVPGQQLNKKQIEEVFDTSFGYRMHGINIRHAESPRLIILFFDSGQYDDNPKPGDSFIYVGEGIDGDQDKDTTGNKALLDARSEKTPIFVFSQDNDSYTFLGRAEVIDCATVNTEDRKVLEFTLQLMGSTGDDKTLPNVFIAPVENLWQYRSYVKDSIDISDYEDLPYQLHSQEKVRLWAFDSSNIPLSVHTDVFFRGDFVLFYYDGELIGGGRVKQYIQNPYLGNEFWDDPCCRHVITIEEFSEDVISLEELWEGLQFDSRWTVDGFTRIPPAKLANLREIIGDLQQGLLETQEKSNDQESELDSASINLCDHDEEYKDAINPGITLGIAGFSIGRNSTKIYCHKCNQNFRTNQSLLSVLKATSSASVFGKLSD